MAKEVLDRGSAFSLEKTNFAVLHANYLLNLVTKKNSKE